MHMNVTSLQRREEEGKKIDTKLYAVQSRTAHAFLLRRTVGFIYTFWRLGVERWHFCLRDTSCSAKCHRRAAVGHWISLYVK